MGANESVELGYQSRMVSKRPQASDNDEWCLWVEKGRYTRKNKRVQTVVVVQIVARGELEVVKGSAGVEGFASGCLATRAYIVCLAFGNIPP